MLKGQTHACMGCKTTIVSPLFCFSCNSVQRIKATHDFFEVLGLPYQYDIDLEQLEDNYQNLVSELHPDLYTQGSAFEKSQSMKSSQLLNLAYKTLFNSHSRAIYLSKILNQDLQVKANPSQAQFLEDLFELQEFIDQALNDKNQTDQLEEKKLLVKTSLNNLNSALISNFNKLKENPETKPEILPEILRLINEQKYLKQVHSRF